jgi:hypothetical protein
MWLIRQVFCQQAEADACTWIAHGAHISVARLPNVVAVVAAVA